MNITTLIGITVGAVGTAALAPVLIPAAGFTAGGIAAGSWASWMMSSAAVANGGGVAAGSLVAVLQSVGAAGMSTAASTVVASVGGAVGGAIAWAFT
ncbi:interferon alpha-inducible protein 27-like protein 2A [Hoplias malabaricus]|uniref:interferon alpha-inducible protein 27-like protein 2A n=1 Tax=Hoplias malabaricus TaxID=27720 RepID=UPI0034627F48